MEKIERIHTGARMSQVVVHGNTVYLAGQVGTPNRNVAEQTREAMARVDELLGDAGSITTGS